MSVPSCGAVSEMGLPTSTQPVASESWFSSMSLGTLPSAVCEGEVEFLWSPLNTWPENTQNREDQESTCDSDKILHLLIKSLSFSGSSNLQSGIQTPLPWNHCPAFNRKICRKHPT